MSENSFSIKLGREELVCALSLLGARGLPGLSEDYFKNAGEEEIRQTLNAGFNALRARDLVQEQLNPDNAQPLVVLNQALLAVIGTCLRAPRVIFINHIPLGGPVIPWYIHLGPYLSVIHHCPQVELHEFFATVDRGEVLQAIDGLMELDAQAACLLEDSFTLPGQLYDEAVAQSQQRQADQAEQRLTGAGLPAKAAGLLAQAIASPLATTTLSLVTLNDTGRASFLEQLALIQAPGQLWSMRSAGEVNLQLQMTTREKVQLTLKTWAGC